MLKHMWRKGNSPTLLVEMQIGTATVENRMEVPQKTKNPASPLPGIYLDKTTNIIQKDISPLCS